MDHNDPGKLGRIKVRFFWQDDNSTHWARATAPHAGPDRGFMFLPEIGDEVAVAFEDGAGDSGEGVDVKKWMPDHAHWFVNKEADAQRKDFFGHGGLFLCCSSLTPRRRHNCRRYGES